MAAKITSSIFRGHVNGSYCYVMRRYRLINSLLSRQTLVRTFASISEQDGKSENEGQYVNLNTDDDFDEEELEAQIMARRDVSRLPDNLKRMMYHREEVPTFEGRHVQLEREYKRQLYGKMGKKSSVDASLFYPFEDEFKEMMEERELFEPPLEQLIASAQAKVDERERERREKEELVLKNMAKMPKLIAQYKEKLRAQEEEERKRMDKAKAMLAEAREYFGYDVDKDDPRFEEMVAEKEAREQEARKKLKREARQAASLAQMLALQEKAKQEREAALKKEQE